MGQYRYFYSKYLFQDKPQYSLVAAGMSTGFTEGMLYTPFEIIKIRMQVRLHSIDRILHGTLLTSCCAHRPSTATCARA